MGIFLALPQVFLTTTWDEKKVLQKKNSFKENNKQMETCQFISELKENVSHSHTHHPPIFLDPRKLCFHSLFKKMISTFSRSLVLLLIPNFYKIMSVSLF